MGVLPAEESVVRDALGSMKSSRTAGAMELKCSLLPKNSQAK